MHRSRVLAFLLLSSAAAAQTYSYSPSRYATQPGGSVHNQFGSSPAGRCMFMDGDFRGLPMGIKEIAFRPSWSSSAALLSPDKRPGYFAARSWSQMTLRMSRCDATAAEATFSANPTSPPTTVFQGAMSWPEFGQFTSARPLPFSIKVPLRATWQHTGTEDICMDFQYSGGVLSGSTPWSEHTQYPLGAFSQGRFAISGARAGLSASARGCVDSAPGNSWGRASSSVNIWAYSPQHPIPSYRGQYSVSVGAMGVEGSVILAAGLNGRFRGVPFPGVTCNELYLDPAMPWITLSKTAQRQMVSHSFPSQRHFATLVGLGIWSQSAWLDSVTGELKLSAAGLALIPDLPLDPSPIRVHVFTDDPTQATGVGYAGALQPVLRYAR